MIHTGDVRDFDGMLKRRIVLYRQKLREWLAPHRLAVAEIRVHRVLIPMVGVYTPGWQALPAISWELVEIVTKQGLTGTGEWPIGLDERARNCIEELRADPERNVLDPSLEEPLYMAWWDLAGQVLGKPLHVLWADLFESNPHPPSQIPMAAYTWQRFPDHNGLHAVTFENWPALAAQHAANGFSAIKVSMTAYEPEDHIDLVHRIRKAVGPEILIRIDAHGTWNYQEARRILPALEDCNLEYIEQPVNSLLPQRYYPAGETVPVRSSSKGGFQAEYYFRRMTELRHQIRTPLSCHWWTPPIVHPPGATEMSNCWEPNWRLLERYEAADVSVPDIGLGPWGLWRLARLAKFMGMHVTVHSNFELCLQLSFRSALVSALIYEPESAGLYMGTAPRVCHAIDNETIQVSDDVIRGGQFDWTGGHLKLLQTPGHGLTLDPERLDRYRYTPESAARHREYARKIRENYVLDRPRRTSQSGWPKRNTAEHFDRHVWPFQLSNILEDGEEQDIDLRLNC